VFVTDNAYLEVTVGTETLLPRTKINSVGYAMQAGGLSAGGIAAVVVSLNGNVGIGTTNPATLLNVYKNGSAYTAAAHFWDDVADGIPFISVGKTSTMGADNAIVLGYDNANNYGWLAVGGDSRTQGLIIANGGSVGIGATAPGAKLDIFGPFEQLAIRNSSAFTGSSGQLTRMLLKSNTGSSWGWFGYQDTATNYAGGGNNLIVSNYLNGPIVFNTNGETEAVRITSGGKVGVGTTAPNTKLQVYGDSGNLIKLQSSTGMGTAGQAMGISFVQLGDIEVSRVESITEAAGKIGLRLYTYNNGAVERVRIDNAGNVGIATPTPQMRLSVYGADSVQLGDNQAIGSMVLSGPDNWKGIIWTNVTGNARKSIRYDNTTGLLIFSDLTAAGHYNDRLVLGSNGNVGIGKTAFTSNGAKLQVADGLTFPAVRVPLADANTLDGYEEGTFIPHFKTGGTGGSGGSDISGVTYDPALTVGYYTRIGNVVNVQYQIAWSGSGLAGNTQIYVQLPYKGAVDCRGGLAVGVASGIAQHNVIAEINSKCAYLLTYGESGHTHFTGANITAGGSRLYAVSGSYITSDN
jgi:hypothetical protein